MSLVGAKGKEVPSEVFNKKITQEDIEILKENGIDDPLMDEIEIN